jgi:hypothetical protein
LLANDLSVNRHIPHTLASSASIHHAGDVVDTTNFGTRLEELIGSVGAKLVYLPAYSFDLNPIEVCFSILKQRVLTDSLSGRSMSKLECKARASLYACEISEATMRGCFRDCLLLDDVAGDEKDAEGAEAGLVALATGMLTTVAFAAAVVAGVI